MQQNSKPGLETSNSAENKNAGTPSSDTVATQPLNSRIPEQQNPDYYIKGVLEQNRRVLAKTITLVESVLPAHREMAALVMDGLIPHTGNSVRLGITGVPGVGKSTFVENLGLTLAEKGHKVAVLAVDPSSRRSGGSILGDKTRMEKLACHPNTFIRPSPSGETLGGVAARTREIMLVCEAAGFDVIMVETVGVGQSEITVATMVDFFLALMIAGAGDELQGIKKGILEVADAIVVNKADGDNLQRAMQAQQEYSIAMHMMTPESPSWRPPVLTCSSVIANGTDNVWETVMSHRQKMMETGEFNQRRKKQALEWMWHLINEDLKLRFRENKKVRQHLSDVSSKVEQQVVSPTAAAQALLAYFYMKM